MCDGVLMDVVAEADDAVDEVWRALLRTLGPSVRVAEIGV
jgi:hypothetical protein